MTEQPPHLAWAVKIKYKYDLRFPDFPTEFLAGRYTLSYLPQYKVDPAHEGCLTALFKTRREARIAAKLVDDRHRTDYNSPTATVVRVEVTVKIKD